MITIYDLLKQRDKYLELIERREEDEELKYSEEVALNAILDLDCFHRNSEFKVKQFFNALELLVDAENF
jgi:hypothetical protein